MPLFSIIVPVFNGEQFIISCFNSVIHQSFKDWEIIFINDGSTDRTKQLLDELALSNKIRILTKENEGVAKAREIGIQHSKGDYLIFLDVDDTLEPGSLEYFYHTILHHNSDILVGGFNIYSEDKRLLSQINYHNLEISQQEALQDICEGKIRWQLWAKAFRKTLFDSTITPLGLRNGEDMVVCFQAFEKARKISLLDKIVYNYVLVSSSATHARAYEISMDAIKAAKLVEKGLKSKINSTFIRTLFLLIISSVLRIGVDSKNTILRDTLEKHFRFKALKHLPIHKAISILIFKFFNINLAKYIK